MTVWMGYPQHPDAHPERPWWRRSLHRRSTDGITEQWTRIDGGVQEADDCPSAAERVAMLDRYDAAHPLPAPPPLCGQVWVWPGEHKARLVVAVFDGEPVFIGWTFSHSLNQSVALDMANAVLVAGPHSPWAPMGGPRG